MVRDWDPEVVVTEELASRLVATQFPELRPVRALLFANGFDNTAFRINDAQIFRFPRRAVAAPLLLNEVRVLPLISSLSDVAVPIPKWLGNKTKEFPWPFAGYPLLPGSPAWSAQLSHQDRGTLADGIGRFLKQIHGASRADYSGLDLPGDTIGKLDLGKRLPLLNKLFDEFAVRGLPFHPDQFSYIIERACRWVDRLSRLTLVHGDFHAGNFLVDSDAKLCGVVDWGDVHIGDPAVDLSCVHGFIPRSFHQRFRACYGHIDEATWDIARFRALYVAIVVLFYGEDNDLPHAAQEGLTALQFLLDGGNE